MAAVAILNFKYAVNGSRDTRDGILDLIKYTILDLLPPLMVGPYV